MQWGLWEKQSGLEKPLIASQLYPDQLCFHEIETQEFEVILIYCSGPPSNHTEVSCYKQAFCKAFFTDFLK